MVTTFFNASYQICLCCTPTSMGSISLTVLVAAFLCLCTEMKRLISVDAYARMERIDTLTQLQAMLQYLNVGVEHSMPKPPLASTELSSHFCIADDNPSAKSTPTHRHTHTRTHAHTDHGEEWGNGCVLHMQPTKGPRPRPSR
jgi:hypothetical protein